VTDPTLIAHRGFAGRYPENTVGAVRGAVSCGADAVEIDVQPTADGDVVVFHDRRLDTCTDQTGVVWEQSTATVTDACVLGTDERVSLLSDVLNAIPARTTVNVELKNPGTDSIRSGEALGETARETARQRWQPLVESVQAVVDGFDHDVLYSSFCDGALAALDTVAPTAQTAVLVAPGCAVAGATIARRYDVDAIHPCIDDADATPLVEAADEIDASRNVWTISDWQEAQTALRRGADGIIADYPGVIETIR
jgi:glycerophosphoryl diester phosphodiesterase